MHVNVLIILNTRRKATQLLLQSVYLRYYLACTLVVNHRISRYRMRAPISCQVKKMSPQNGGFIRATELAPILFVGKGKPFFFN